MSPIPIGIPAINTFLYLGSTASPPVYGNPIANVGDISGPTMSKTIVDVTSHSNPNPWRQKITTLIDGGDLTLPLFFDPADDSAGGHQVLLGIFATVGQDGIRWYKLQFPDDDLTTYYFQASISKFSLEEKVADVIRATVVFTVTGEIQLVTTAG